MLCLSDVLGGFLVCGSLTEKSMAKSRQKTATENPFPTKLWGGVIGGVADRERDIQNNKPRKAGGLCEA